MTFALRLGAQAAATTPPPSPAPSPAPAAAPATLPPLPMSKPGDEIIESFKLTEGDIDSVLGALETYTGRAIIRPGTLPVASGGYTLKLSHVPRYELVLALETLLSLNQIGVVPLGDRFLKVVPLSLVRSETPEFISGSSLDLPPSSRVATKLFQLDFLRVGEFFGQGLNMMFTPGIGGGLIMLEKANAALVTDTISNLQRLELLIDALDKPVTNGFTPKFYSLHYAKASDLVTKQLHTLLNGPLQNQIGSATTYAADDRTNQVIVICDPREQPFFDDLIGKLDVASDPNTRNEVIYLKHADAKDVTSLLSALVSGQTTAAQKASGGQSTSVTGYATPPPPALGTNSAVQSAIQGLGNATNVFSSFLTIQPDERTNSVVVSGNPDDIRLIKALIEKLDITLAQVRIQVIIAEVSLTDTDISGINSLGLTVGTGSSGTHITNFTGGITGWDVTSGVVNPLAFNAAFNASSTGSKNLIHVLQAPVIVTAHNKPAEVTVGQKYPIINGGQSSALGVGGVGTGGGLVNSYSSSYQDVAVDLTVTPLIGNNGDIQLTIDQKVDDIGGSITIQAGDVQPIIDHREMKSFITVSDGQMIVLGGLQKTNKTTDHSKIGFLYEIPIISQLLGGHTDTLTRTELLFFIRPQILPPAEGTADVLKRISELSNRDQINQFLANPAPQPESKPKNLLDRFKKD